jgi:hypothetical protein
MLLWVRENLSLGMHMLYDTCTSHSHSLTNWPTDINTMHNVRGQLIVRLLLSTRGHIIRGLDLGVQHMTLGETSTIKVHIYLTSHSLILSLLYSIYYHIILFAVVFCN